MSRNEILAVLGDYKARFAQKYGILDIGIFGSVARDEARNDSDVDICVKTATPNPFVLVHIKEDIERRLHLKVDIVRVRDNMNPCLKSRIEAEGIYV